MQSPDLVPPPPPAPQVRITTEQDGQQVLIQEPMTARDLRAIRNRRDNLSDQLISVQSRRKDVADALHGADPAARPGLQDRLNVLDQRIVQLETDIATTGRELTSASAGRAAVGPSGGREFFLDASRGDGPAFFGGMFTGMAFLAVVMWVRRGRGGRGRHQPLAGVPPEQFTRLEQSIDSIAVEVERISEGQRFTAKLMADGQDRMRREAAVRDA